MRRPAAAFACLVLLCCPYPSWSQANLGYFYATGGGGLAKDAREAARLYKLAADQGNEYAARAIEKAGQGGAPTGHPTRRAVWEARAALAYTRTTDLAPIVSELRAAGAT